MYLISHYNSEKSAFCKFNINYVIAKNKRDNYHHRRSYHHQHNNNCRNDVDIAIISAAQSFVRLLAINLVIPAQRMSITVLDSLYSIIGYNIFYMKSLNVLHACLTTTLHYKYVATFLTLILSSMLCVSLPLLNVISS